MLDVEQLKKDLEETIRALGKIESGTLPHRLLIEQKNAITTQLLGIREITQGNDNQGTLQNSIEIGGNQSGILVKGRKNQIIQKSTIILAENGAQIVIGKQSVEMKPKLRKTVLGRYLEHVIAHNRYLQLQGIRSGGKLVNIELEQIYITLRTTQRNSPVPTTGQYVFETKKEFTADEIEKDAGMEIANMPVEQALAMHQHLVILGDPGSGKTTLLRYLALLYGRDLAQGQEIVATKLKLAETGYLPILLPLRQIGQFLTAHHEKDDGTGGHGLLLAFLLQLLKNHKLDLPVDFFDSALEKGQAVILLDGLDEVADPNLRARVARLVEAFTLAYPICRFVVTSRVVGYSGAARLGADYISTIMRDFTLKDVEKFLTHWHRLVAIGQMGIGQDAEVYATSQTQQLLNAIQANERVRALAINPLMLTVIVLVHRDRVKLPDRRAELYAEVMDVLLGKWDEARGVGEFAVLEGRPFDVADRRLLLQNIAFFMHEREKKELYVEELRSLLILFFKRMTPDKTTARQATDKFLMLVEERTGVLLARGEGIYAFSHLTFQEYLVALAIAARDDYVDVVLKHAGHTWWREAILLTAGYLSTQSIERTTKLVRAIAESKKEPVAYHNLILASECIHDIGTNRLSSEVDVYVKQQLRKVLNIPQKAVKIIFERQILGKLKPDWMERRAQAVEALARAGTGHWYPPYGEPEWITIPAGEFWMGGHGEYDGKPAHKFYLPEYQIARVPVTNAQYALFVKATNHKPPPNWDESRPPKEMESHPVVNVSWDDVVAYCAWLSKTIDKTTSLPSEAEWEKAARGHQDQRAYPWGNDFSAWFCNTRELGLGGTTPTGIFLEGASPYGLLDMGGNVWEWTRTLADVRFKYPYKIDDGREEVKNQSRRVLRGGSFNYDAGNARCACRNSFSPLMLDRSVGFRIMIYPCQNISS